MKVYAGNQGLLINANGYYSLKPVGAISAFQNAEEMVVCFGWMG